MDERTDTAGSGRTGASSGLAPKPLSALCTLAISCGRSLTATLLLLTCAETMSAVKVIRVSVSSLLSAMLRLQNFLSTDGCDLAPEAANDPFWWFLQAKIKPNTNCGYSLEFLARVRASKSWPSRPL